MAKGGTATMGGSRGGSPAMGGRAGNFGAAVKSGSKGPVFSIGSKEGGSFGGGKPTFSSRVLAETRPAISLGRPDISPAGLKARISGEKMTVRSGEVFHRTGLGDKASEFGQARNRSAAPEVRRLRTNPFKTEFKPNQDIIKRTGRFGLPAESVRPQKQPSTETVKRIVNEIGQEYAKTHGLAVPKTRPGIDVPAVKPVGPEVTPITPGISLPTAETVAKRVTYDGSFGAPRLGTIEAVRHALKKIETKTKQEIRPRVDGAIITSIPGIEKFASQKVSLVKTGVKSEPIKARTDALAGNRPQRSESLIKRMKGTKSASGYLRALRQKESLKLDEEQGDVVTTKQTLRQRAERTVQSLQRTVGQRLLYLTPDERALSQFDTQTQVATISHQAEGLKLLLKKQIQVQTVEAELGEEVSRLTTPLTQRIEQTEKQAQGLILVQSQAQNEAVLIETDKADPENIEPETKKPTVLYSIDGAAANARLQQVVEASSIVFTRKEPEETVTGFDIVRAMKEATHETTSDIAKSDKESTHSVVGLDGSDPEWRRDLRLVGTVTRDNIIRVGQKLIRRKPPVQQGPGEGVTEEDRARVQRANKKEVARSLVQAA